MSDRTLEQTRALGVETTGIEIIDVPAADPYTVQGDAFSAAVRDGTPVPIPPADAVANLRVIERILAP